jgi:hypothetical protein
MGCENQINKLSAQICKNKKNLLKILKILCDIEKNKKL